MRLFLDTNVILDFLTAREPFVDAAEMVIELCTRKGNAGAFTTLSACNIVYILSKKIGRTAAEEFLKSFIDLVPLVGVTPQAVLEALYSEHVDFEDAVQLAEARVWRADVIVTRDPAGFSMSDIPVRTPDDVIDSLS